MIGTDNISYSIHNCDICDTANVESLIAEDLRRFGKRTVDHIIIHPPYLDIVKFTDLPEDLSHIDNVPLFIDRFTLAINNCWHWLKSGKYISLVIGDIYRNGEVIPLSFYLMYAIKKYFPVLLKGIVVKDITGNRGKIGNEGLWKYRALKSDTFLFKHEYVFVFKKNSSHKK